MSFSSNFVPTIEYTRAVCTCGKELSTIFYQHTAQDYFFEFLTEFSGFDIEDSRIIDDIMENMKFLKSEELHANARMFSLKFCCIMNLRFGIRESIAIIETNINDSRKYPSGLPGPLSREKTLSWY
jgi:hypothetical protein